MTQLSSLHFNFASKPLVTLTTGTSCRLQKLNYSEALGMSEVHDWISASAVSAAVALEYHGTTLCFMWTPWAWHKKCCVDICFNSVHILQRIDVKLLLSLFFCIHVQMCNTDVSEKEIILFEIIFYHCFFLTSNLIKTQDLTFEVTLTSRDSTSCAWSTPLWHLHTLNLYSATALDFI